MSNPRKNKVTAAKVLDGSPQDFTIVLAQYGLPVKCNGKKLTFVFSLQGFPIFLVKMPAFFGVLGKSIVKVGHGRSSICQRNRFGVL